MAGQGEQPRRNKSSGDGGPNTNQPQHQQPEHQHQQHQQKLRILGQPHLGEALIAAAAGLPKSSKVSFAWSRKRANGTIERIADAGKPIYGVSEVDVGCELLVEATVRSADGSTKVLAASTARIRLQGDAGIRTTRALETKDAFGRHIQIQPGHAHVHSRPGALPVSPGQQPQPGDGEGGAGANGVHGNGMGSVSSEPKDQLAGALPAMVKGGGGGVGKGAPVPQLPLGSEHHQRQRRAAGDDDDDDVDHGVTPSGVNLMYSGEARHDTAWRSMQDPSGGKVSKKGKSRKGQQLPASDFTMHDLMAHVLPGPSGNTYTSPLFESSDVAKANKDEEHKLESDEYLEVLTTIKALTKQRLRHMGKFFTLFVFVIFVVFYCTVVFLQTSPTLSYLVGSTVDGLLKPSETSTQDPNYFYSWLNDQVIEPVWTEVICGDDRCQPPYEIPAFGRFGCKADCGVAANLVTLVLQITSQFAHPVVSPFELMVQARWNLCLTVPERESSDLMDECWFEEDQVFEEVNTNRLERVQVIQGRWYIKVTGDYLGLVGGRIYRDEGNSLLKVLPTLPEWSSCSTKGGFTADAGTEGGARRLLVNGYEAAQAEQGGDGHGLGRDHHHREPGVNFTTPAIMGNGTPPMQRVEIRRELSLGGKHHRPRDPSSAASSPSSAAVSATGRRLLQSTASLYFNGTETLHPYVAYIAALAPTSQLTFEAWIRPTTASPTSSQFLVSLGDGGWGVFIAAGGSAEGSCNGKTTNTIGFFSGTCANSTYSLASGGLVAVDTWQHVAVTVNTTATTYQVKIYIDGVDKTGPVGSNVTIGNGGGSLPLKIGAAGSCTGCLTYAGYIDEMRIWGTALDAATILKWMPWEIGSGSTWHPSYSSLVLHFTFDEATGTAAVDSTSVKYDAVVPATAWSGSTKATVTATPVAPSPPPPSPPPPLPPPILIPSSCVCSRFTVTSYSGMSGPR